MRTWLCFSCATLVMTAALPVAPAGRDKTYDLLVTTAAHAAVTLSQNAVGVNTAVWDGHLQDPLVVEFLRQTPITLLRFPGGSTADTYHWRDNTITQGLSGYANPSNTYDAFIRNVALPTRAQVILTVNYGTNATGTEGGDPAEAAAWVADANRQHHFGIRYWEIGNEVYGNGYYGQRWEADKHHDHSPTAYARNALAYIAAMKHIDPSIKIGIVLAAPGNWPDGQGPLDWNHTVLSIAGRAADFVVVHWYAQQPGSESDAGLLASPAHVPDMTAALRSVIVRTCGPACAARLGIMVTETNSVAFDPGKQTTGPVNGLFLVSDYLAWLAAGVQNVDWWDLHNGPVTGKNNSAHLAGTTAYGDYGLLATGDGAEPSANAPFPTFTALRLLKGILIPGATFLRVATTAPADVSAYALRRPDGRVAVVLINVNRSAAYTLRIRIPSIPPGLADTTLTFSAHARGLSGGTLAARGGGFLLLLRAYSATVLVFNT